MLHKTGKKNYSCFVHYFLLYVLVLTYLSFVSCSAVQKELIPDRNTSLGNLPEIKQEKYLTLMQQLSDDEKEKLEQRINAITQQEVLEKVIENYHEVYLNLLKLLPKPERTAFSQAFAKAVDPDDQRKLIDQYASPLKMLQDAPMPTRQHYIDLLEILPDDQAAALKKTIVQSTSPDEVDHLIASKLPDAFRQLGDDAKENLSKLSAHERQKILASAINQNPNNTLVEQPTHQDGSALYPSKQPVVGDKPTAIHSSTPNDGHLTISTAHLDINKLIEEKVKKQQDEDEDIPQDGWGTKLSLEGEERKQFLTSIMQFSQSDQKALKDLFDKADPDPIDNFLSVYYDGFNKNERIELLATMIYLYKGWPNDTIKLCNKPTSLTIWGQYSLFRRTEAAQLALLEKLKNLLS